MGETCAGQDNLKTWGEKCETFAADVDKATCCPLGKKLIECMTPDCMTLQMAFEKMAADKGDAESKKGVKETEAARKDCPDAGIPSASAVSATAKDGKVVKSTGGKSGDAADFAAGQTVSMLAVAA